MSIAQYIQVLKEGWWLATATILVCLGVGLAYSYAQTPIYEAQATFVANPTGVLSETSQRLDSLDTLARRDGLINTYCHVLQSQTVRDKAAGSLGVNAQVAQNYNVTCTVLPDSSVLQLRVEGPAPQLAADLVDAIGAEGIVYISELQDIFELRRLDTAVIPDEASSPNHTLDVVLSLFVGLAGGVAILALRLLLARLPAVRPVNAVAAESAPESGNAV